MKTSKVIVNGDIIADLTQDTVAASDIAYGTIAINKNGDSINGTANFGAASALSPEYATYSLPNNAQVIATYCNGAMSLNVKPDQVFPSRGSETNVGTLPSSWGMSSPSIEAGFSSGYSPNISSMCENRPFDIQDGNIYHNLGVFQTGPNRMSCFSIFGNDSFSFPESLETWSLDVSSTSGLLSDSSFITITKFGNFSFLDADLVFLDDHRSSAWLTITTLPEKFRPAIDVSAPGTSDDTNNSICNAAVTTSGDVKFRTEADRSILLVKLNGTSAKYHYHFSTFYPLNLGTKVN